MYQLFYGFVIQISCLILASAYFLGLINYTYTLIKQKQANQAHTTTVESFATEIREENYASFSKEEKQIVNQAILKEEEEPIFVVTTKQIPLNWASLSVSLFSIYLSQPLLRAPPYIAV